jgi:hypothetical protein
VLFTVDIRERPYEIDVVVHSTNIFRTSYHILIGCSFCMQHVLCPNNGVKVIILVWIIRYKYIFMTYT